MAIVNSMRTVSSLFAALLATCALAVAVAPAQASSVTDQYTEQIPTPGGSGNQTGNGGTTPGGSGKATTSNSGNSNSGGNSSGSEAGTDYGSTDSGYDSTSSGSTDYSSGSDSSGSDSSGKKDKQAGKKDADKQAKADSTDDQSGDKAKLSSIAPSGGDDGGDGMGWIFPVAIVVVAGAVGGFAYFKRHKGRLAT